MQEEVNEKVIALSIKTGKLSAEVLQKSMKFFLSQVKKQANKRQMPHGKQTLKQLMKQNAGVSNIEITKDNIKALKSYFGTGLFAIFIHPVTFYCSSFPLDMSIYFLLCTKIFLIVHGLFIAIVRLSAYNID